VKKMLAYRPITFFWIAEFADGTAISQFDPETGKENKADPDWLPSAKGQPKIPKNPIYHEKRVVKIGWYPFNRNFAAKVLQATGQIVIPTNNRYHTVDVKKGDRVLIKRENIINFNLSGQELRRETVYIIGIIGGKVLRIREDGSVEK